MDKILTPVPSHFLPAKAVEIVYVDGTTERFNVEGDPGVNQMGFYVFQRGLGQPPIIVNHTQVRKLTPLISAIQ